MKGSTQQREREDVMTIAHPAARELADAPDFRRASGPLRMPSVDWMKPSQAPESTSHMDGVQSLSINAAISTPALFLLAGLIWFRFFKR